MCILFIHRNPNASENFYKLIVAANRDETYKRPAKSAHFWQNHPDCLGGTDEEPGREGGTWLAMSTTGRAGIILNLTGESGRNIEAGKGRGNLVVDYVTSKNSSVDYLNDLHATNQREQSYNPFSLVLIDMHDAEVNYLSSSLDSTGPVSCDDNILGFGNSHVERPFAKVRAGKKDFEGIVNGVETDNRDRLIDDLRELLKSEKRHLPDSELQERSPDCYECLSSIFVRDDEAGYGTRTHSIILVDGANRVTFYEETRISDGTWNEQLYEIVLK